jgi:hypothetical protein
MIDNGSITLDHAVHSQVATIPSIGDFPVLERFDCSLYGIDSCAAVLQDEHGELGSAAVASVIMHRSRGQIYILVASLEVDLLVLVAVVACACMYIYATDFIARRTACSFPRKPFDWIGAVDGRIRAGGGRHALVCGEKLSDRAKPGSNRVQP